MDRTLDMFGAQSALIPAGIGARTAYDLTIWMTGAGVAIFVLVMGLVWLAWQHGGAPRAWWIWGGGVVFPLVVLTILVVASTLTLRAQPRGDRDGLVIEITGHQFWWDIVYDPEGRALRDANELRIPVGRPVTLRLKSDDVIHSFWVPSIAGKLDMIPGRVNELTVTATKEGRFRGQCAEFCGLSHPLMALDLVAMPESGFSTWLNGAQAEARDAARPELLRGREVFLNAGCTACHSVRGVATGGVLGPDLTRVGARPTLGAGMWPMNLGNMAGWIADAPGMKPGVAMPRFNSLSGPDLRAVAEWLVSLK